MSSLLSNFNSLNVLSEKEILHNIENSPNDQTHQITEDSYDPIPYAKAFNNPYIFEEKFNGQSNESNEKSTKKQYRIKIPPLILNNNIHHQPQPQNHTTNDKKKALTSREIAIKDHHHDYYNPKLTERDNTSKDAKSHFGQDSKTENRIQCLCIPKSKLFDEHLGKKKIALMNYETPSYRTKKNQVNFQEKSLARSLNKPKNIIEEICNLDLENKSLSNTIGMLLSGKINNNSISNEKNPFSSRNKSESIKQDNITKNSARFEFEIDSPRPCVNTIHRKLYSYDRDTPSSNSKSKDAFMTDKIYKMDEKYEYNIKINNDIGKELLNIESMRSTEDQNKMEKLLKFRERFREKYLVDDQDLASPRKVTESNSCHSLIKYKDQVMPFSLAILAKIRRSLVQEIKSMHSDPKLAESKKQHNRAQKIIELKDKILPEEEAKFMSDMNKEQKKRRLNDLKCKGYCSNPYYSVFALNHFSQDRLQKKFEEVLPQTSRFRNIY